MRSKIAARAVPADLHRYGGVDTSADHVRNSGTAETAFYLHFLPVPGLGGVMLEITLIVLAMLVNVVAIVVGVAVSRQWSRTALGIALLFVLAVNVAGVFGQIIKVRRVQAKEDAVLARKDMLVKLLGDEISNASGIEYRLEERMTHRAMTQPALDAFVKEIEEWRKGVGERLDELLPGTYAAHIFLAARGEFPGAYLAVEGRTQVQVGLTPGFYQYTRVRGCRSALTAILASVDSFVRLSSDLKAPAVTERARADAGSDARSLNKRANMAGNVDWQMVSALATVVYTLVS